MIASLMMYARPELNDAHNRLWENIREQLSSNNINSPPLLSQNAEPFSVWQHPDLVLSQTCGMPYRNTLYNNVKLIGTPNYNLHECPPGYYRSAIVIHRDDSRTSFSQYKNSILAYNQSSSQSGYAAIFSHVKDYGFWFQKGLCSGSHLKSAEAVSKGKADIAALDAMTWHLINQYEDIFNDLKVLDWTAPTPGLPLITALKHDPDIIFNCVNRAIAELEDSDRQLLGLDKLVKIHASKYLAVENPVFDEDMVEINYS